MVWTTARNLANIAEFSPGPRKGAASSGVSKREMLIVGGMTLNTGASDGKCEGGGSYRAELIGLHCSRILGGKGSIQTTWPV